MYFNGALSPSCFKQWHYGNERFVSFHQRNKINSTCSLKNFAEILKICTVLEIRLCNLLSLFCVTYTGLWRFPNSDVSKQCLLPNPNYKNHYNTSIKSLLFSCFYIKPIKISIIEHISNKMLFFSMYKVKNYQTNAK